MIARPKRYAHTPTSGGASERIVSSTSTRKRGAAAPLFHYSVMITTILKQLAGPAAENRAVSHFVAVTNDVEQRAIPTGDLPQFADRLGDATAVPVGSVEFVRAAMQVAGIAEPSNLSYPSSLRPFLRRPVTLVKVADLSFPAFVKPTVTKLFTGVVARNVSDLPDHVPLTLEVWESPIVSFTAEYRVYVNRGHIIGIGRYDDLDTTASPSLDEVHAMIAAFDSAPIAYSIDVGIDADGRTTLVEVNDAWALGLYANAMHPVTYVNMLISRWRELCNQTPIN